MPNCKFIWLNLPKIDKIRCPKAYSIKLMECHKKKCEIKLIRNSTTLRKYIVIQLSGKCF